MILLDVTAFAGLFGYKRKIALHRQWATRSYPIALVFRAGRFVLGFTGWKAFGVEIASAITWACLALSVVLADVAIHWKTQNQGQACDFAILGRRLRDHSTIRWRV